MTPCAEPPPDGAAGARQDLARFTHFPPGAGGTAAAAALAALLAGAAMAALRRVRRSRPGA